MRRTVRRSGRNSGEARAVSGSGEANPQGAAERRVLRSKYLAVKSLINDKKRDISVGDAEKFNSIISEVETLHQHVQKPREQVADAEALFDIANTLVTSVKSFDHEGVTPADFISFLVKKYGRSGPLSEEGSAVFAWNDLGVVVSHIFKKAHGCCTMLGPMNLEVKQRNARVGRRATKPSKTEKPKEVRDSGEEKTDTDKNMSAMFDILRRKRNVRLENLVLNRESFAQTVENIFALSFLVKDGRAHISVNEKGHHIVSPKNAPSAAAVTSGDVSFTHFVFAFGSNDWKLMKSAVVVGEELIPNRTYVDINTAESESSSRSSSSEPPEEMVDVKPSVAIRTPIRKLSRNRGLVLQDNQIVEDTPEQGTVADGDLSPTSQNTEHVADGNVSSPTQNFLARENLSPRHQNAETVADACLSPSNHNDVARDDLSLPHQNQNGVARDNSATGVGRKVFIVRGSSSHDVIDNQARNLEQEAYSSVLRLFKARSDIITWDKESSITKLRKELRITNDENISFLGEVDKNGVDIIGRISDWEQERGLHIVPALYENQKIFRSTPSLSKSRSRAVPEREFLVGARPKKPKAVPPDDMDREGDYPEISDNSFSVRGDLGTRRKIDGACKRKLDDIYIFDTDTLLKKYERTDPSLYQAQQIFNASDSDPQERKKAKDTLKEHEKMLADAIAKLKESEDEHHYSKRPKK